jgi:threonine/homoserine/homoserine lactone efflux protein
LVFPPPLQPFFSNFKNKEKKLNTNRKTTAMDRKVLLSTLWIFVVLNYLYCDVVSLMDARMLKQYLAGNAGGMEITQGFLLGAGILMEISISMVLLSRVLNYKANRWANILAGLITTVVQFASLVSFQPTMYYLFFSIIEIASTAVIVWIAWTWRNPEASPDIK